jgi:hypothetical protein
MPRYTEEFYEIQEENSVNPPRGCGRKVRGGSYLESGETSPDGELARLTWVLGTHRASAEQDVMLYTDADAVSRRGMQFFNPAATLAEGYVVHAENYQPTSRDARDLYDRYLGIVGALGLIDYVGDSSYDPWQFATEVMQYGASRRVTRPFMLRVAPMLPLPVFFAHRGLPYFDDAATILLAENAAWRTLDIDPRNTTDMPTWYWTEWGMRAEGRSGDNHFMVPVLKALHTDETSMTESAAFERADYVEAVFCASWLTRGVYVHQDEHDTGVHQDNVENVVLFSGGGSVTSGDQYVRTGTNPNLFDNISRAFDSAEENMHSVAQAMEDLGSATGAIGDSLANALRSDSAGDN